MVTIKRIEVVSAMKVGALVSAGIFTVFGVFILGLQSLAISSVTSSLNSAGVGGASSNIALFGIAGCLFAYVIGVVFSAIFGAIYFAVVAFLYNLVSNWVGGLRVELDLPVSEKAKRDEATGFPV